MQVVRQTTHIYSVVVVIPFPVVASFACRLLLRYNISHILAIPVSSWQFKLIECVILYPTNIPSPHIIFIPHLIDVVLDHLPVASRARHPNAPFAQQNTIHPSPHTRKTLINYRMFETNDFQRQRYNTYCIPT